MGGSQRYKILLLTRYDRLGPSSRVRFLQFLPALAAQGFDFDIRPFLGNDYISALFSGRKLSIASIARSYWTRLTTLLKRGRYDLIWLEKEALPWLPAWIETRLMSGVPYVVDFDDAWFHRYDLHRSALLRSMLGKKIDIVMRQATTVVVGNDYLADRARQAGAQRIVVIPSAIDLDRYPPMSSTGPISAQTGRPVVVGWIGTPMTAHYLASIEPAVRKISAEVPMILRVIGAKAPTAFDGLATEAASWSEDTEVQQIIDIDIGIMPLADTLWEKGKCAYKLLQIMAAGRPVVASPVGANCTVVQHGVNGFLASSTEEWATALRQLVSDSALRHRLGVAARQTVEQNYSMKKALPPLISALKNAIGR